MDQSQALGLHRSELPPPQLLLAKGIVSCQVRMPTFHPLRRSVIYSVPQFVTFLRKLDLHLLESCQIHTLVLHKLVQSIALDRECSEQHVVSW